MRGVDVELTTRAKLKGTAGVLALAFWTWLLKVPEGNNASIKRGNSQCVVVQLPNGLRENGSREPFSDCLDWIWGPSARRGPFQNAQAGLRRSRVITSLSPLSPNVGFNSDL